MAIIISQNGQNAKKVDKSILGRVDLLANSSSPPRRKLAIQYFKVRSLNGHILASCLSRIGFIQRYFSSLVELGIVFGRCP